MPLGAPIGTNKGLKTRDLLEIIIAESRVPVVIDAGLGAPSHAADAMEMGADAVFVNTAIAAAAIRGDGRSVQAHSRSRAQSFILAGLGRQSTFAQATSPPTSFLD